MESPGTITKSSAVSVPSLLHPLTPEMNETSAKPAPSSPQAAGYGLPCANCRTYYLSTLKTCPVCKSPERVSPVAVRRDTPSTPKCSAEQLEQIRDRKMRELRSEAYVPPIQINAVENSKCAMEENHAGGFEPATVCRNCYSQLQGRADLMEAALHIDLNDATQLIYNAVWADPSDPVKTYQNAARALLAELHKRAGISAVLGPLQPRSH
jgi:hypothetical protein